MTNNKAIENKPYLQDLFDHMKGYLYKIKRDGYDNYYYKAENDIHAIEE